MQVARSFVPFPFAILALAASVAALSGCGGAGTDDTGTHAGSADPAAYAATMEYCGSVEPTGNSTQAGGWDLTSPHHPASPLYDVSALVSVDGADGPASQAPTLQVDIHDYRNVAGKFIPAAYAEPNWKMGVQLQNAFAPKSAACVVSLGKLVSVSVPAPGLPGAINPGAYTLSWRSKWSTAVPVERLPGKTLDGFEFVTNFAPGAARAFFVVSKQRQPSAQGVSVCFLAPSSAQWDCAASEVYDRGTDWQLVRSNAQSGVYVAVSPQ